MRHTGGALSSLDPRAPYVVSVRDLGRRAGSMQQAVRTVPAMADLGSGLARVPEGSDVEVSMRLESVVEGVLVSGKVRVGVRAECARCLDPIAWEEDADFTELFVYPRQDARGHVVEDDIDDEEAPPRIEGDLIDLEATVRDAVVLRLPLAPVCQDDCAGLCPQCGVRLGDDPGHQHEVSDSRWAALTALRTDEGAPETPDAPEEKED